MLKAVRRRLAAAQPPGERDAADDAGMSLVEVIAAMLIFAIVSTGIAYSMLSVLNLTRDTRARQVAANLAAQEIDLARSHESAFKVLDRTDDVSLNGDTFHIDRRSQWVSDPGSELPCGATSGGTGGVLRYKRVNVTVTWDNMRAGTKPVRSDTIIDPKAPINDPTKGTILVSVLDSSGIGVAGMGVSTSPTISGITATDPQGCTYVLEVPPGDYTVRVSRSGYLSGDQEAIEQESVTVAAGASASVGFLFDRAATFQASLAPGVAGTVSVPSNLTTTFWNTYGYYPREPDHGSGSRTQRFVLHPYASGYQAFAGQCTLANPDEWPVEEVDATTELRGVLPEASVALGGSSTTVEVPMGVLRLSGAGTGHLRAVSTDGGCDTTLRYGNVLGSGGGSGNATIALPYGSWRLERSNNGSTGWSAISAARITETGVPERTSFAGNVVTLDPRVEVEVTE